MRANADTALGFIIGLLLGSLMLNAHCAPQDDAREAAEEYRDAMVMAAHSGPHKNHPRECFTQRDQRLCVERNLWVEMHCRGKSAWEVPACLRK